MRRAKGTEKDNGKECAQQQNDEGRVRRKMGGATIDNWPVGTNLSLLREGGSVLQTGDARRSRLCALDTGSTREDVVCCCWNEGCSCSPGMRE
jgi:hypothetical protein